MGTSDKETDSDDKFNKVKRRYEVALETRKFEIDLFWRRSVFFWGFIAAAFIAYATFSGTDKSNAANVRLMLSLFGLVCSFCWTLANRGSKYWQENWEQHVAGLEDQVTGKLFKDRKPPEKKNLWLRAREYSVSKLVIALSDYTTLIWVALSLHSLREQIFAKRIIESAYWPFHLSDDEWVSVWVGLTIIWIACILVFARTSKVQHQSSVTT